MRTNNPLANIISTLPEQDLTAIKKGEIALSTLRWVCARYGDSFVDFCKRFSPARQEEMARYDYLCCCATWSILTPKVVDAAYSQGAAVDWLTIHINYHFAELGRPKTVQGAASIARTILSRSQTFKIPEYMLFLARARGGEYGASYDGSSEQIGKQLTEFARWRQSSLPSLMREARKYEERLNSKK